MEKVFTCQSCGFLSTLRSAFEKYEGLIICTDCVSDHQAGEDPAHTWVEQAIRNKP
jgi:transcription elongation factor Elf1